MSDEKGYVKFNYDWIKRNIEFAQFDEVNSTRTDLYNLGLIGEENGIGYGNLSIRNEMGFIISGTNTGGIEELTEKDYALVNKWDLNKNWIKCTGMTNASSESLTHAAIYENSDANAVIHIHHYDLWRKLLHKTPTTKEEIEYGTPEMAKEIAKLIEIGNFGKRKVIVMEGHENGIIGFGRNVEEVYNQIAH
tara:strand:- start:2479 stop:3054 length:576 start_codon:yes stop_codon:yes gene_type:complete